MTGLPNNLLAQGRMEMSDKTRAVDLAYEDVKDMSKGLVSLFKARYGGWEFEEMMGEAELAFAQAWNTYQRDRGASFLTWVRFRTWHALMKAMGHRMREARRERREVERMNRRGREFDFDDFLGSLSEDAQEAIRLAVLLPPLDMELSLIRRGNQEQPSSRTLRAALREVLQDRGWPPRHIERVFAEIQEAL